MLVFTAIIFWTPINDNIFTSLHIYKYIISSYHLLKMTSTYDTSSKIA